MFVRAKSQRGGKKTQFFLKVLYCAHVWVFGDWPASLSQRNFIDPQKMVLVNFCLSWNCCFVVPFTCLKGAEITQVAEVRDLQGSGSVQLASATSKVKWSHVCFIRELILVNQFWQEVPEDFGVSRPQNIHLRLRFQLDRSDMSVCAAWTTGGCCCCCCCCLEVWC